LAVAFLAGQESFRNPYFLNWFPYYILQEDKHTTVAIDQDSSEYNLQKLGKISKFGSQLKL